MAENKELTQDEIKEAIEKKHCPYCKSKEFMGFFPAWQRFDSDVGSYSRKTPLYYEPDTSADFEKIKCNKCWKEIPVIIWRDWELIK